MSAQQLEKQIAEQKQLVAEAEEVVRRRIEWDAQQRTTASHAGLLEAKRDLRFYQKGLRDLEAELAAQEVTR